MRKLVVVAIRPRLQRLAVEQPLVGKQLVG